jgi:hypothetical protein
MTTLTGQVSCTPPSSNHHVVSTGVVRIHLVLSVGSCGVEPARNVCTEPYIESVFENDLGELDAAGTLAAAEHNEHALITAETRRLHIAAHWADLHPGDALTQSRIPGTQHPIRLGGDGTPPSPTSQPPNSAVCCAYQTGQRPG